MNKTSLQLILFTLMVQVLGQYVQPVELHTSSFAGNDRSDVAVVSSCHESLYIELV